MQDVVSTASEEDGAIRWTAYFPLMKAPISLLLFALLGAPIISCAQQASAPKAWGLTCFNSALGVETDRFRTMSLDHLMGFAKTTSELERDLDGFEATVATKTSGLGFFIGAGFGRKTVPTDATAPTTTSEVQVGVGIHTPREAMVTYRNKDMDTSIVYCNLQSEISLETAWILKGQWSRFVHWNVGLGANGGITVGNKMMVIEGRYLADGEHPSRQQAYEMNKHTFGAKQAYYTRIFLPTGVKFRVGPRWQIGMDYRLGMGWQFVPGHGTNVIEFTNAVLLGVKYRLN